MTIKTLAKSNVKTFIITLVKNIHGTFKNDYFWMTVMSIAFSFMLASEIGDSFESHIDKTTNDDDKSHMSEDVTGYPKIHWWNYNSFYNNNLLECPKNIKCLVYDQAAKVDEPHAYMFYGSNLIFCQMPPRNPKGAIWVLFHEESPANVLQLSFEPILNLFNYSATFSRYSDVPFPLMHVISMSNITSSKFFVKTEIKNEYSKEISPILYLNSNCNTMINRNEYVEALMEFIKIDSYGLCLNNKRFESEDLNQENYILNLHSDNFYKFVARYKFVIAIENGRCDDYITEKFWRPIMVGSVPIYFGSPTIKDWLPNEKSALLIEDFPTPKHLADQIKILMTNDTMYEEYLMHKTMKIISNKKLLRYASFRVYQFDFVDIIHKLDCFICEKLHNKLNGDQQWSVVNRNHYYCPKPISALSMSVNSSNYWLVFWEQVASYVKSLK